MLWVPTASSEVVRLALPPNKFTWPSTVESSLQVTVLVGWKPPLTVAVKVTELPLQIVVAEELSTVVVLSIDTEPSARISLAMTAVGVVSLPSAPPTRKADERVSSTRCIACHLDPPPFKVRTSELEAKLASGVPSVSRRRRLEPTPSAYTRSLKSVSTSTTGSLGFSARPALPNDRSGTPAGVRRATYPPSHWPPNTTLPELSIVTVFTSPPATRNAGARPPVP